MARTLTPDEVRHYEEQGYVVMRGVFPRHFIDEVNEELDRIVERGRYERPTDQDRSEGWILGLRLASEKAASICEDERVVNLVRDIVHPGVAIYSALVAAKAPRCDEVCHWHQDEAYYHTVSESRRRMSVWVPLQDTDEANGCLEVIPGSHREGLLPYRRWDRGNCVLGLEPEVVDASRAVPLPVSAGDVILFSALLWHYSGENRTDRMRRALIITMQEATSTAGKGEQWKILRPAPEAAAAV